MKAQLDRALAAAAAAPADLGVLDEIVRADVDPSGSLVLFCAQPNQFLWLQLDGQDLVERSPAGDALLPLASDLGEPGALRDQSRSHGDERFELLSYRPGRRLVLRRHANGVSCVQKGYRKQRWKDAAIRHRVAEAATILRDGFRVPRLLDEDAETSSLTFEEIAGEGLSINQTAAERFFAIGTALRSFQDANVEVGELDLFGPRNELEVIAGWKRRVLQTAGKLPDGWDEVSVAATRALESLPRGEIVLAHRDLHDRQMLQTRDGVALLDFDLLCLADTCLDPANLLAHLSLRSLQDLHGTDEAAATACGQALLDGLNRDEDPGFWERLRFYQGTTFLRLALVYSLRPKWFDLPPELLELSGRCFAEMR